MCQRPPNLPALPSQADNDGGWQGWVHWLGSGGIVKASTFALWPNTGLCTAPSTWATQKEWWAWCKAGERPPDVLSNPERTCKGGGWQGWVHWLGSSDLKPAPFLPFVQALAFAQSLGLATEKESDQDCLQIRYRASRAPRCQTNDFLRS